MGTNRLLSTRFLAALGMTRGRTNRLWAYSAWNFAAPPGACSAPELAKRWQAT
jgi:hypothetical protein